LPPVGGEVSDPILVEVEQNSFQRWRVHTRTLPATRCDEASLPGRCLYFLRWGVDAE
jgi:hypothetical protein